MRGVLQIVGVLFLCVLVFVLDSCSRGPVQYRDPYLDYVNHAPKVHVGLSKLNNAKSAKIKLTDSSDVFYNDKKIAKISSDSSQITIIGNSLKLFGKSFTNFPIKIVSRDEFFIVNDKQYRGNLLIYLKNGSITYVNEIDMENYLAGVLGKEMSTMYSTVDSLKSQAVAARTYALHEIQSKRLRNAGEDFDLFDDERSQVYGGTEQESEKAFNIMESTRGLVLTFKNELINTFYSSTCGGHTEPSWEVLEIPPKIEPLSGVPCPYCKDSKHFMWSAKFSKLEMGKKLTGKNKKVTKINISKKAKGGHALRISVLIEGEKKESDLHANLEFRRKLGPQNLKSTLFVEIKDIGDEFEIKGRGFGHGAGMCQVGAMQMGKEGFKFYDILNHYYPGSKLKKLY